MSNLFDRNSAAQLRSVFLRVRVPIALLLLSWVSPCDLMACSCASDDPFLKVANRTDLVIRGTVIGHEERRDWRQAMNVRVHEVLRGRSDVQTIRVWGGNSSACNPEVAGFPVGTEWVFALNDSAGEDNLGYTMSTCSTYWLRLVDGMARGAIRGATPDTLLLSQLRDLVRMGLLALISDEPPHLVGTVSAASAWSTDVVRDRDGVPDTTSARVFLTQGTTVIDRKGRKYSPGSIPLGRRVSIWFTGPLAPFSAPKGGPFPVSAKVVTMVVEDVR